MHVIFITRSSAMLAKNLFLKVEQTFPAIMQLEELVQNMKGLAELTFTNE